METMHTIMSEPKMPMLEGIGDEVLFAIVSFIICMLVFMFMHIADARNLLRAWFVRWFGNTEEAEIAVPVRPYNGGTCPICLQNTSLGLETNCGHVFCGPCMIDYWHHGNFGLSAMKCALCRQNVTMMFAVFSEEEYNADNSSAVGERRQALLREMNQYNRTFSGMPRTVAQVLRDSPVLVRHLLNDLVSDRGILRMFQLRIIFCVFGGVFYLFCPVDIIPETFFGMLGLIDDVLVLLLIFIYLSTIYHRIMISRANALIWNDSDDD